VEKHRASAYRRLDLSGVIGLVRLIFQAEQEEKGAEQKPEVVST